MMGFTKSGSITDSVGNSRDLMRGFMWNFSMKSIVRKITCYWFYYLQHKQCKYLQKPAVWVLEHMLEDFPLVSLVDESLMYMLENRHYDIKVSGNFHFQMSWSCRRNPGTENWFERNISALISMVPFGVMRAQNLSLAAE